MVEGKDGEEYYGPSDCTQFGTLALTLNWQGTPRWTLVLDKGFSTENPDGGSLTLCRVSMDPTAPMQFTHVSLGEEPEESD